MTRLLPKSLFGQTALILLAGLIVSHAVGSWIYTAEMKFQLLNASRLLAHPVEQQLSALRCEADVRDERSWPIVGKRRDVIVRL